VQRRVITRALRSRRAGEEEEALPRRVIPRAVEVGAVLEHAKNPVERVSELVARGRAK